MLIHVEPSRDNFRVIDGKAHIVISLDAQGNAAMRAYFCDRPDSSYGNLPDAKLLHRELPKLLAELREQLLSVASHA